MTVTLLVMALVASPAVLFASKPFDYPSVLAALTFSAICIALAWNQWTKHSDLTIPSILPRRK